MELTTQRRHQISWAAVRTQLLNLVGRAMDRVHSPAMLKEFEYVDPISDQTVYLSTGARYSVLHVGNVELFFDRATGRFDGTNRSLQERIETGLELFD